PHQRRLRRRVQRRLRLRGFDPDPDFPPQRSLGRKSEGRRGVMEPRECKVFVVNVGLAAYIALTSVLVYSFPRSFSAFLLFEAALFLIYYAPLARAAKLGFTAAVLIVLMPFLGAIEGYYIEVAIQIGIYVALALGLNIVVGFVGLLNLGFVAFYAIGAYL